MSRSEQLRKNKLQHLPKNILSKGDDKKVAEAMKQVIEYLDNRFNLNKLGYYRVTEHGFVRHQLKTKLSIMHSVIC